MIVAEKAYDTDGSIRHLFHSTLYYPREIGLQFDGYIVGIEKSPRTIILGNTGLKTFVQNDAGVLGENNAKKHLDDGALLFVSHILKQRSGAGVGVNCAIYNVYAEHVADDKRMPLVDFCDESQRKFPLAHQAYEESWKALSTLQGDIRQALDSAVETKTGANGSHAKKYTHLIVVTMGWNTDQIEAVRNINSIVGNLVYSYNSAQNMEGTKERMVPLVIGVTWPSMWVYSFADPLVKVASFPTKANDANELGLTWLGVLLNQTVPNAKAASVSAKNIPTVVIGHSFGSRASIIAACVGPVIYNDHPVLGLAKIDYLINLQGAFVSKQLLEPGVFSPEGCPSVRSLVLTSSKWDSANKIPSYIPGWDYYAGDEKSFKKYCGPDAAKSSIQCAIAAGDGTYSVTTTSTSNILYVNADSLITEQAFGSGDFGGAHSDIYRREHGKLINQIITAGPGGNHRRQSTVTQNDGSVSAIGVNSQ